MSEKHPIGVVGVGWVGLVSAACFAELGHDVWCRDIDRDKIAALREGRVSIFEPDLEELVARNTERLHFEQELGPVLERARLLFVCVDTPPTPSGDADLSRVAAVIEELPDSTEHAIVMKSTVPVGTGASIRRRLTEMGKPGLGYVSNPEFLKEGSAVADFMHPDRVVVGADEQSSWAADEVAALYEPLGGEIVRTDAASAEMIKMASNAFLATKISFINEIANVCEETGADVAEVAHGMGLDPRIGRSFLNPGIGYGGSCLAGDETVIIRTSCGQRQVKIEDLFKKLERQFGAKGDHLQVTRPEGLEVLSWSGAYDECEYLDVDIATRRWYEGPAVEVRAANGASIRCTADHPFIVASDGRFRISEAQDLIAGDELPLAPLGAALANVAGGPGDPRSDVGAVATLRAERTAVTSVTTFEFRGPVFSLELPESHTFVTSGGVVVHNCFPKDVSALKQLAGNSGYHFQLLNAVIEVNQLQKRRVVNKLKKHLGSLVGKNVALLGLAFKPNTDDMREASSVVLAARLQGEGATVRAYDPVAEGSAAELMPGVEMCESALDAVNGADAAVIVTEWPEFAQLDLDEARKRMANPLLVDGRNLLDPDAARAAGFTYEGIGRSNGS